MITDDAGPTLPADPARVRTLVAALEEYRHARERLLVVLGHSSNRDPLAEMAEHLVTALIGGTLARNRVQKGWDIELPDGAKAQVKYLANASGPWINEHLVHRIEAVYWYVLVIIEAFAVRGVLAFPVDLAPIGRALGKRHSSQDTTLQFTRANWQAIQSDPHLFQALGLRVWFPLFEIGTDYTWLGPSTTSRTTDRSCSPSSAASHKTARAPNSGPPCGLNASSMIVTVVGSRFPAS
ncbi:MAG: hypothetical protein ACRDSL_08010 [Pseudonocardiaceae bacterium]